MQLQSLFVGGALPLRVLKLNLVAQSDPKNSDSTDFYQLFDTQVTVSTTKIVNEVKRLGYILDTTPLPCLEIRPGDSIVVYF